MSALIETTSALMIETFINNQKMKLDNNINADIITKILKDEIYEMHKLNNKKITSFVNKKNINIIPKIIKNKPNEILAKCCDILLNNSCEDLNYNLMRQVEWFMVNNSITQTKLVIYNSIYKKVDKIRNKLLLLIKNKKPVANKYAKEIYKYYKSVKNLLSLSIFQKVVDNKTNYVETETISKILFYNEILLYRYNDKYLTDIIIDEMRHEINQPYSFDEKYHTYVMIIGHKMHYSKFIQTINNKTKLNLEKNDFPVDLLVEENTQLMNHIVKYINEMIIKEGTNEDSLKKIINMLKILSNMSEKSQFIEYYKKYLLERLITGNNFKLELNLLEFLANVKNKELLEKCFYYIQDAIENEKLLETMNKVTLQSVYKDVNCEQLIVTTMRNKIYDNQNNRITKMILPEFIVPCVEIYDKMYKKIFPNRKLTWDFNIGMSVAKVTLNNEEYILRLKNVQFIMLYHFKNRVKITANDLCEKMGLPIKIIGDILTSLLRADIIVTYDEDIKIINDPDTFFKINEDFYNSNKRLSLVELLDIPKKKLVKSDDEFAIGKNNILQACIVKTTKLLKNKIEHNILMKECQEKIIFLFDEKLFEEAIKICLKKKYIKIITDDKTYYEYMNV